MCPIWLAVRAELMPVFRRDDSPLFTGMGESINLMSRRLQKLPLKDEDVDSGRILLAQLNEI